MNFKTAALGTMITAGTVLGGCAKKEGAEAAKIMEKVDIELCYKQLAKKAFDSKDTVMFNALRKIDVAEKEVDIAKTNLKQKIAEFMFKRDSIDFANKKDKNILDSIRYQLSESNVDNEKINGTYKELQKALIESQIIR